MIGRAQRSVVIVTALVVGACSSAPAPAPSGALTIEQATRTYGHGAAPAAGVTYQPDVVFLQAGPAAIRSASSDGLSWRIDRNTAGAADLSVGKVMVLTSRATGRIVALTDEGDTRVVTLAPVDMTEIVSDGTFSFDQPIDLNTLSAQLIPDMPGQLGEPEPSDALPSPSALGMDEPIAMAGALDIGLPTLRLGGRASDLADDQAQLPPALQPRQCIEVAVSSWSSKPCVENGNVSLAIDYKGNPALKVGVVITLRTSNLRFRGSSTIAGGVLTGQTAVLEGIQGVNVEIAGASANGSADNQQVKVEVPIEMNVQIPPVPLTLNLPTTLKLEWKYILETAFSTKNSTLTAAGSYDLTGPIGIEGGEFKTPTFTRVKSMLDSIEGVTLAVSGLLVAAKVKVQIGLGVPAALAGPYVAFTTSAGLSLGSPLALVVCRALTLDLKGGVGFGVSMTGDFLKAISKKLPSAKIKTETEKIWSIFNRSQAVPEACA